MELEHTYLGLVHSAILYHQDVAEALNLFSEEFASGDYPQFETRLQTISSNYDLMKDINGGKQMKDVWIGPLTKKAEKWAGKHPTQKPEYLLERIILASTKENDYILDPFVGSGTTGVVAKRLGRKFIGIDAEKDYLEIAKRRLEEER